MMASSHPAMRKDFVLPPTLQINHNDDSIMDEYSEKSPEPSPLSMVPEPMTARKSQSSVSKRQPLEPPSTAPRSARAMAESAATPISPEEIMAPGFGEEEKKIEDFADSTPLVEEEEPHDDDDDDILSAPCDQVAGSLPEVPSPYSPPPASLMSESSSATRKKSSSTRTARTSNASIRTRQQCHRPMNEVHLRQSTTSSRLSQARRSLRGSLDRLSQDENMSLNSMPDDVDDMDLQQGRRKSRVQPSNLLPAVVQLKQDLNNAHQAAFLMQQENRALQKEMNIKETQFEKFVAELQQKHKADIELKEENFAKELDSLKEEIVKIAMDSSPKNDLDEAHAKIESLASQVKEHNSKMSEVCQLVESKDAEVKALKSELDNNNLTISDLEKEVLENEALLQESRAEARENHEEWQSTLSKLNDAQAMMEEQERELHQNSSDFQELKDQLSQRESQLKEAHEKFEASSHDCDALRAKLQTTIQSTEKAAQVLEAEEAKLLEALQKKSAECDLLAIELDDMQQAIATVENASKKDVEYWKNELSVAHKAYREQLDSQAEAMSKWAGELREREEALSNANSIIADLRAEKFGLRQELSKQLRRVSVGCQTSEALESPAAAAHLTPVTKETTNQDEQLAAAPASGLKEVATSTEGDSPPDQSIQDNGENHLSAEANKKETSPADYTAEFSAIQKELTEIVTEQALSAVLDMLQNVKAGAVDEAKASVAAMSDDLATTVARDALVAVHGRFNAKGSEVRQIHENSNRNISTPIAQEEKAVSEAGNQSLSYSTTAEKSAPKSDIPPTTPTQNPASRAKSSPTSTKIAKSIRSSPASGKSSAKSTEKEARRLQTQQKEWQDETNQLLNSIQRECNEVFERNRSQHSKLSLQSVSPRGLLDTSHDSGSSSGSSSLMEADPPSSPDFFASTPLDDMIDLDRTLDETEALVRSLMGTD